MKNKHPNQPIIIAKDGCIRFKQNHIVDKLLTLCTEKLNYSLNDIHCEFLWQKNPEYIDDYKQLMQLIGYSVSGYGELTMIPIREINRADRVAGKIQKQIVIKE